jgi:hypothetical protein
MRNSIGSSGIACSADINDDRLIAPDCSHCDRRAARPRSGGEDRRLWCKAIGRRSIPRAFRPHPWVTAGGQVSCLGQKLPSVQVHDDRRDPRPVLHRPVRARRRGGPGPLPAPAFPLDQLMLGHRDRGFGQVEDLAALHPGDRPPGQARPAPSAAARLVSQLPVRPGHLGSVLPSCPSWPPGLRPVFFRSDCGRGGGLSSPSLDGGLDEFRGLCLSRASSSAIRSRACARFSCARASAARDSASSPRSAATSAATTSSAEPALSPATPGRYYQPGHPSGDHSSL